MLEEATSASEVLDAFMSQAASVVSKLNELEDETQDALETLRADNKSYAGDAEKSSEEWQSLPSNSKGLHQAAEQLEPLAEISRNLLKQVDQLFKFIEKQAKESGERGLNKVIKELDEQRKKTVEQLKLVRYFYKQSQWLQERFPEAELQDVEGLVKLVDMEEIEANDWSLTPGRYVGVAPEVEDEDFDFEETLRDIHIELKGLNEEAILLAAQIQENFEGLGI